MGRAEFSGSFCDGDLVTLRSLGIGPADDEGKEAFARTAGKGAPLLLLHGFTETRPFGENCGPESPEGKDRQS